MSLAFSKIHFFDSLRLLFTIVLLLLTVQDFEENFLCWGIAFIIPNIAISLLIAMYSASFTQFFWFIITSSLAIATIHIFQHLRSTSITSDNAHSDLQRELEIEKANSLTTIIHLSLLGGTKEKSKAISQAYHVLEKSFGIKHSLIFLADQPNNTLFPAYKEVGKPKNTIPTILVEPYFWSKYALASGKSIMNLMNSQKKFQSLNSIIPEAPIETLVALPLSIGGTIFGLLTILKKQSENQKLPDVSLFQAFGYILASTLDNCQIHETRNIQLNTAEANASEIKASFGKYVSASVVDELIRNKNPIVGGRVMKVSVLMADLRGFTALSKKLPIETLVLVLNKWFDRASQLILKSNGTIDKYMGDCIMVLFGAPTQKFDDVLTCVYTSFRLHERFNEFQKEIQPIIGNTELGLGISITTGEAIVGNFGSNHRMEYTAIGETINLAARLEKLARPQEIVVDEETFNQIPQTKFKYEIEENVPIKGLGSRNIIRLMEVLRNPVRKLPFK